MQQVTAAGRQAAGGEAAAAWRYRCGGGGRWQVVEWWQAGRWCSAGRCGQAEVQASRCSVQVQVAAGSLLPRQARSLQNPGRQAVAGAGRQWCSVAGGGGVVGVGRKWQVVGRRW